VVGSAETNLVQMQHKQDHFYFCNRVTKASRGELLSQLVFISHSEAESSKANVK